MNRAGLLAVCLGFAAATAPAELAFREVSYSAGLHAERRPLPFPFANMTGGGTVGDFNHDGWQDLFLLGGGAAADALYLNHGDGTFGDYAAAAGVADHHRGIAVAVGDYDGDGRIDLYVTSLGDATEPARIRRHRLYRNTGLVAGGGDTSVAVPVFRDVAEREGVNGPIIARPDAMGAAFGDYDLDGDLDLFVTAYAEAVGNRLYHNLGREAPRFADATATIAGDLTIWGFAPTFADMDGDRYPELLIAADFGTSRYLRNGAAGSHGGSGAFVDATSASGADRDANGMGSAIADFNNDGLLDWYLTAVYADGGAVTGDNGSMLYINRGGHRFHELAAAAGVDNGGWGWGAVAVDLDHDGWLDIVATNGWEKANSNGISEWLDELTRVFLNDGGRTFRDVTIESGLQHRRHGRGLLNLDYDNDGDQDILIVNERGPMSLYRNELSGPGHNWLRVFADTSAAPGLAPHGFGTRIAVSVGGRWQHRVIHGGSTFSGVAELSAHFGLGDAETVDLLRVTWADGRVSEWHATAGNRTITVSPDGTAATVDATLRPRLARRAR